ncbi:hypothetical protein [Streptomyces sp. NPDC048386]|uniref:hypothetical protein n=1 Tax=Streptomyces sp. NPDC048386 TaxID=3365541 RepID=UPI003713D43F
MIVITDDGVGGADPPRASGSGLAGLAGLAKRVASVDGAFSCPSPRGPTVADHRPVPAVLRFLGVANDQGAGLLRQQTRACHVSLR